MFPFGVEDSGNSHSLWAVRIGITRRVSTAEGIRPRKTNGEGSQNFSALINLTVPRETGDQHSARYPLFVMINPELGHLTMLPGQSYRLTLEGGGGLG